VRGLIIASYERALPGVKGRPTLAETDIFRGAVGFLHASLEDLLRSILEWKLPSTVKPEHLDDVALDGEKLRRYTLGDVARHRGRTVDDLIDRSVKGYLERSKFNNVDEVAGVLVRSGLATAVLDAHGLDLESMMKRRQWIVHRADRNQARGQGVVRSSSRSTGTPSRRGPHRWRPLARRFLSCFLWFSTTRDVPASAWMRMRGLGESRRLRSL
jgi:hypothetical protein